MTTPLDLLNRAVYFELSQADYKRSVRAAVRGLWSGKLDRFGFFESLGISIERGFERAWREGAAVCGILPDERKPDEQDALTRMINAQFPYIAGFADAIEAGSKANKGLLRPQMRRAELWISRYGEVKDRAQSISCADLKLKWSLGPSVEHCKSCLKLNGQVRRASMWEKAQIWPKHPDLECGGFNCKCTRTPTTDPLSRGRMPKIP